MTAYLDRFYHDVICFGLIATVWFGAFYGAAHDVWAASVVFGSITFLAVVFCIGRWRDQKPVQFPLSFSLAFFLFSIWFSVGHSYDVETSRLEFWGWVFTVLGFYLFINVIDSPGKLERFMLLCGSVVIPLAFICLAQQLTQEPVGYGLWQIPWPMGPPKQLRLGHWEIHATLINSVVLAGFLLYWSLFFWQKSLENRRYSPLLLACLIGLALARSWWAFGALLTGMLYYYRTALRTCADDHPKIAAGLSALLLILLIFLVHLKMQNRPEGVSAHASYHIGARGKYWSSAAMMWRQHPARGVGIGAFATAYPHFKNGAVENTRFAHSFPLQMISETGTLGLLALLGLLFDYFRTRRRTASSSWRQSPIFDAVLVSVLGFSMISINMDYLLNKFLLLILVGATLMFRAGPGYRVRPLWMATGGICLLLASAFWINLLVASRLYTAGTMAERQGNTLQAVHFYRQALDTETCSAESAYRLSQIYQNAYQRSRSAEDLAGAKAHFQQAIRCKKDIRFALKGNG